MGEERLLLKTQKNEILQGITELKLNPSDFEFHRIKSGLVIGCVVSKLFHKPTKYYFTFDFTHNVNEHWIEYFPTRDGKKRIESTRHTQLVMENVLDWLMVIKGK